MLLHVDGCPLQGEFAERQYAPLRGNPQDLHEPLERRQETLAKMGQGVGGV
jgi:hypothetical protein